MKLHSMMRNISGLLLLGPVVVFSLLSGVCYKLWKVSASEQARGLRVYLPHECGETDAYDNRRVILQILGGSRFKINQMDIPSNVLAERMSAIYETRIERVLNVVVEDGVPYGDVVSGINLVQAAVPKLVVLLIDQRVKDAVWRACISSKEVEREYR